MEKALTGSRRYWMWLAFLLGAIAVAGVVYLRQLDEGLGITGLSRDVSWGLYIGQFTFFVGVAASAVVVVLPFYLHRARQFARITLLGEFLAMAAVVMCVLFIFVDLGQPARVLNILLYPTPSSLMFWDMLSLSGYLIINASLTWAALRHERDELPHPAWMRTVALISIPWAVSIHTVTAFLYCGLPGRSHWMTAILAPRFLASAFAAGPALLILLCLFLRRAADYDPGEGAVKTLSTIMTYAAVINVFFMLVEIFTVGYARIPEHTQPLTYLYFGLDGAYRMAPFMCLSGVLLLVAVALLLTPRALGFRWTLPVACVLIFASLWMEKGLGLIVGGFVPSPLGNLTEYVPTLPEWTIVAGIWAVGALLVTVFVRIAIVVRGAERHACMEHAQGD